MCSRFTILPLPALANASKPEHSEPPMPIAIVVRCASCFMMRLAAIAAPNTPVCPGAWKPISSLVCLAASPVRSMHSFPATSAVRKSRPLAPYSSATANAPTVAVDPG
jgi:hypothetical protein